MRSLGSGPCLTTNYRVILGHCLAVISDKELNSSGPLLTLHSRRQVELSNWTTSHHVYW